MHISRTRRRLSWLAFGVTAALSILMVWQYNALRESEVLAERMLRGTPVGLVVCDENGHVLLFNQRAEELTGYSEQEMREDGIEQLLLESEREAHKKAMNVAFWRLHANEQGWSSPRRMEVKLRHKDGHEVDIQLAIRGAYSGDRTRFVATMSPANLRWPKEDLSEIKP